MPKIYENNKDLAEKFLLKVQEELENNKNEQKGNNFVNKILLYSDLISGFNMKLNLPKKVLGSNYNKKEYFDFISSCSLYYILSSLGKIEMEEIIKIYEYFNEFKNILENDDKLENYQKSIIITEFSKKLERYKNVSDFKLIKFRYYNRKEFKKNSPLFSALLLLDNIINDLDEQSPFFYPLNLIDSGIYHFSANYRNELAYGYGIYPCNLLKEHLNDVVPEIFITINDNKFYKEDQGMTEKSSGGVTLNLCSELLSPLKDKNLYEIIDDIDTLNDLSLRLFLVLFHEILGHKKSGYSSTYADEDIGLSPNIFFDKTKKKIMKLDFLFSTNISDNVIKILRDPESNSDSGSFLEYFLGECKYGFISFLIEEMLINNINLNFIFNANLWNKDIDILKKYIELKYLVFYKDRNLLKNRIFKDINEEMEYLQISIKNNNLQDNEFSIINKNNEIIYKKSEKKRKDFFSTRINKKIDYHQYDNLTIKDIKKLYMDKNTTYEGKLLCKELLLFRTERK